MHACVCACGVYASVLMLQYYCSTTSNTSQNLKQQK